MPKCQICFLLDVAVSVSDGECMHHLCRPCFAKLDRRFFDLKTMKLPDQYERDEVKRKALEAIDRKYELEKLNYWLSLGDATVNR